MTSRRAIAFLFVAVFAVMLAFTVRAALVRSVLDNGSLLQDVWFQATLVDAYLGFLTFYIWVAWKERFLPYQAPALHGVLSVAVIACWGTLNSKPWGSRK
ncbi:hypothetical protein [Allorhodopirellula solitaria]|uniref:DUF1475 domain-containing protein n=1 Tax=Allorhodopirellula solitaria TaxID=2527987 RepID=A0A5C5WNK7_9BACT|nr:hypothetical protein [Allorhodopirellula solitaria]TWT51679.1 hypothetical protein CA85_52100 [Allorhodopirellula solitaria]